jgi:hypothetical protein
MRRPEGDVVTPAHAGAGSAGVRRTTAILLNS